MLLVKKVGCYGVYELSKNECEELSKPFPMFIAWDWKHPEEVGNIRCSETESSTLEGVVAWLNEWR